MVDALAPEACIPRDQLDKWAELHARDRSPTTEHTDSWLIFLLEGGHYGVRLEAVDGVIRVPGGHFLPETLPGALGLTAWRQELLILWDLAALLGLHRQVKPDPAQRVVLCLDDQGGRCGFLVDAVTGQEELVTTHLQKVPLKQGGCSEGGLGRMDRNGSTLTLLHLPGLLTATQAILKRHRQEAKP